MWIRKIKRKKLQFFLIGIILFFAAAIFTGCLLFSTEANIFVKHYFNRERNYDVFTCISSPDCIKQLNEKAKADPGIEKVNCMDSILVRDAYKLNGASMSGILFLLTKIDDIKNMPYATSIDRGEEASCPKDNEVWITKLYAEKNHAEIGDRITVNGTNLTVSAIIKCAISPNSMMSYNPVLINEATYKKLYDPMNYICFYSIKSSVDKDYSFRFFSDHMEGQKQNILFDYSLSTLIASMFTITLTGSIGMAAAIMIFIVSIVIIKFIINNNLMKEYRAIGIHKALGDSDRVIKGYYIKAYLFIGFLAITIGSFTGILLAYYISRLSTRYIDSFQFSNALILILLLSIFLLMLILTLNLFSSFKSINKITPVNAIRMGITSSRKKLTRSLIKNAHSPLSTAINDIVKHKRASIMMIIMLSFSFYMSIFLVNMGYSISKIPEQGNQWFATPKSDATISGNTSEAVQKYVRNSPYVKNCIMGTFLTIFNYEYDKQKYPFQLEEINSVIYNNWSYELTQIPFTKGRGPENENEIAFSDQLLKESTLQVGDYIDLTVNKVENTFLITGSFNSKLNGGKCIAYHTDIYKLLNMKDVHYSFIFVYLNNPKDYGIFRQDVMTHFDNVNVEEINDEIRTAASSVVDMLTPVCNILIVIFILFSLVNIINLLALENLNNRRQFGILKSLGFSTRYICLKFVSKTMVLTLFSILLAFAGATLSMRGFYHLISGIDSFVFSVLNTGILVAAIVMAILFITLMFCLPLRKIKPRDLMEE
jgi:putative ABC transport system permease protein